MIWHCGGWCWLWFPWHSQLLWNLCSWVWVVTTKIEKKLFSIPILSLYQPAIRQLCSKLSPPNKLITEYETHILWAPLVWKWKKMAEPGFNIREKRIEKKITIRRTESPAPSQRPGSSQSLPRGGSTASTASPAFNRSGNFSNQVKDLFLL